MLITLGQLIVEDINLPFSVFLVLWHNQITYWSFHWRKGTPFAEDQGIYNKLTWWEQMDNGRQLTRNRKFLMVVPVVLYAASSQLKNFLNLFVNVNSITFHLSRKFIIPCYFICLEQRNSWPKFPYTDFLFLNPAPLHEV